MTVEPNLNVWKCPDCETEVGHPTDPAWVANQRREHWRSCPTPGERVVERRVRSGLVPFALPVSPSSLGVYATCPRRYRFSYVDRLPRPSSPMADKGKEFHAFVADRIAGRPSTATLDWADSLDFERLHNYAMGVVFDVEHLVGLEETLNFKWAEGEWTVHAQGRVDALRIDDLGIADVDDWKTGWKVKTTIKDDQDMLFYALAVVRNYSQVVGVRGHQIQVVRGSIRHAFYSLDQIDKFAAYLKRRAKQIIDDQEHRPKPGDHCRTCDFVEHCKVGQEFLGSALAPADRPLVSRENAVQYAQALTQLKALFDRAKEQLETYTDWNGAVTVDDEGEQAWGHWPRSERVVTDKQKFLDACERLGIDPLDVLRPDMEEIKRRKLWKLYDAMDTEVTTYFGFRKNKPRNREFSNGNPAGY